MADKKVTALTDIGTGIAASDVWMVIDDPAGTPGVSVPEAHHTAADA